MKADYAQALLAVMSAGMPVDTALSGLKAALAKKNHSKLFGPILHEVLRQLESDKGASHAIVSIAKPADAVALAAPIAVALKNLGVTTDTEVKEVLDETLVGGFVATFNYQEHDQSYKHALVTLFESITK